MTNHQLPRVPENRSPVFMQAWRAATKYAVTWMHGRAEGLRDPHAKRIMDGSAFEFGQQMKRAWQGEVAVRRDLEVPSIDLVIEVRAMRDAVRDLRTALDSLVGGEAQCCGDEIRIRCEDSDDAVRRLARARDKLERIRKETRHVD